MSKTKQVTKKSLEYYLSLKYPITIYPDEEDGGYTAEIKELPGCITQGETLIEVEENIQDACKLWIEVAYENGDKIPIPLIENSYSGRTLLRMPPSLHYKLAENANIEGVSLNQYILFLLTEQNISHQLSKLVIEKMKNKEIQGTKKGNTIVFDEQLDKIPEGARITVEISENQLANLEKRRENFKNSVGVWKDDSETEKEIIAKADTIRDSNSEKYPKNY